MLVAEIYFYCLLLISLGIFLWGLQKPERIYQFPFTINAIFFAFIIPQCLSIYLSPGASVTPIMIERYFFMACLCLFMSWLGYQVPVIPQKIKQTKTSFSYEKLVSIGIVFVIVAYVASFILTIVPTGRLLTGPATIAIFFRRWVFYGFATLLVCTLSKGIKFNRGLIFLLAALFLILDIILAGRREPTMAFLLVLGSLLYFKRGVVLPRLIPISLVIAILFINPMIGSIRGILSSGDWGKFLELNPVENAYNYYIHYHETNQIDLLEVRNGALLMDATLQDRNYGFGTGYWDAVIKYYVPAQIVGKNLKEALKFNLTDKLVIEEKYNYDYNTGQTFTGIADSFVEFDFFGCFFFFALAYFYKNLWYIAITKNNPLTQIAYSILITSSMLVVTHGTQRFLRDIVILCLLIFLINQYTQIKVMVNKSNHSLDSQLN